MTPELSLRERLVEEADCELVFLEPASLDSAIVGLGERAGQNPAVVYDRNKLLEAFIADGMDFDSAQDWVCTNIEGGSFGTSGPIILSRHSFFE